MVKESGEPVSRSLYLSVVFFFSAQVTPATAALGSPLKALESPKVDLTTLQTANDCAFTTRCVSTRVV